MLDFKSFWRKVLTTSFEIVSMFVVLIMVILHWPFDVKRDGTPRISIHGPTNCSRVIRNPTKR